MIGVVGTDDDEMRLGTWHAPCQTLSHSPTMIVLTRKLFILNWEDWLRGLYSSQFLCLSLEIRPSFRISVTMQYEKSYANQSLQRGRKDAPVCWQCIFKKFPWPACHCQMDEHRQKSSEAYHNFSYCIIFFLYSFHISFFLRRTLRTWDGFISKSHRMLQFKVQQK